MPQITEVDVSVLKGHVISAHYTGIETESLLCVRKSYNFKMVMHSQMVHLQSSHLCMIYKQISTTVLFVIRKCPW